MPDQPSPELQERLARLLLASPADIERAEPRVRRMAGELPRFDCIWLDSLAQLGVITALQASELRAGRGAGLLVGPYVLQKRLPGPAYARCYSAQELESQRPVRLLVVDKLDREPAVVAAELETLALKSRLLSASSLCPIHQAAIDGDRVWAACAPATGKTAAQWLVENGRLSPAAVLQIARQMLVGLAALAQHGLLHGDIAAAGVVLEPCGRIVLPHPGLRAVVRPGEGYAHADLPPEAYDSLAPERVSHGAPISIATEVYACGCLWWQLLTGRPPFAGGSSLAKLRAVHDARSIDLARLAPDAAGPLVAAITACMRHEPGSRPRSFAELAEILGPVEHRGTAVLRRVLEAKTAGLGLHIARSSRRKWHRRATRSSLTIAALAILCLVWQFGRPTNTARSIGKRAALEPAEIQPPALTRPLSPSTGAVRQVSHVTPDLSQRLLLPSNRDLRLKQLRVRPGQVVSGADELRPLICVPPEGLEISADDVRFEQVDFVWDRPTDASAPASGELPVGSPPAMLVVTALQAEFRGCSFQCRPGASTAAAIRWSDPADGPRNAICELRVVDCVFQRVESAVDSRRPGASLRIVNTLHVSSGPLLRLHGCPTKRQPASLSLEHVTVRDSGAVLECLYEPLEDELGQIEVTAVDSVFVPAPEQSLVLLTGTSEPSRLAAAIEWSGQGSVAAPLVPVATWGRHDARHSISDEQVSVAGLVTSPVDFAGEAQRGPAASRLARWSVPLHSDAPPGIGPGLYLPGPRRIGPER